MKKSLSLQGLRVLITRPERQSQGLCEAISRLGGCPIMFPTIAIAEIDDLAAVRVQMQLLTQQDWAIFVSPNAVEKAADFIPNWPAQVKIIAIGPGTARALAQQQWPVDVHPRTEFNSEGLLALSELQAVAHKKIMIFRGQGGRELLANELRNRSAVITEVVVYQRVLPNVPAFIGDVDVIVCTSNTGLQNLLALVDMRRQQLLVSSERMVQAALALGFEKLPLIADNATDQAIVNALIQWRNQPHGTIDL